MLEPGPAGIPGRPQHIPPVPPPRDQARHNGLGPGQRAHLPIWPERSEFDVWYVDNRSLILDLRVLARTVRMLVTGHGLYSGDLTQGWGDGAAAPSEAPPSASD